MLVSDPKNYYSTQTKLAHDLATEFYNSKHYVFVARQFDTEGINHPSSDPSLIHKKWCNADTIEWEKHCNTLTAIAERDLPKSEYLLAQRKINYTPIEEGSDPVVYIISRAAVEPSRLQLSNFFDPAYPGNWERIISDLDISGGSNEVMKSHTDSTPCSNDQL